MGNKKRAKALTLSAMRKSAALRFESMTDNDIAASIKRSSDGFLWSQEWRELRKKTIDRYGCRCMRCGAEPKDKSRVNVDHIKPRKLFPELALDPENLQVLCSTCNKHKGNKHCTDYRNKNISPLVELCPAVT